MPRPLTAAERQYVLSNAAYLTDKQIAARLSLLTGRFVPAHVVEWARVRLGVTKVRGTACRVVSRRPVEAGVGLFVKGRKPRKKKS